MFRLTIAHDRRRAALRSIIVVAAIAFFIMNVAGGFLRDQQTAAPRGGATDQEIEAFLVEQIRDAGYPGAAFAIVRDGRITRSVGIGRADDTGRPVRADTPFVVGSLSKAITATAVMQLVERHLVELDAPITRYLAEFSVAGGRAGEITVRHLLNHTSGLPAAAGTATLSNAVTSLEAHVRALRGVALTSDPGTSFAYSNANYLLLGLLVERVSGLRFEDYVTDAVFRPLRMDDAYTDLASARIGGLTDAHRFWFGIPRSDAPLWRPDFLPAGWLIASADDLARFVAANLNGGMLDGNAVLSAAGIEQMHVGTAPAGSGSYGMGWIDGHLGATRIVSHSGSTTDMGSAMYLAPAKGMGIVVLLNGQSVIYELLHKPEAIAQGAFARMLGEPAGGTLVALYPVFVLAVAAMIVLQLRSLARLVGHARRGEPMVKPFLRSRRLGLALGLWGRLIVPGLVLWTTPGTLGAPWSVLLQIDLGQALAVYALLQFAIGLVWVVPWTARLAGRGQRWGARTATARALGW